MNKPRNTYKVLLINFLEFYQISPDKPMKNDLLFIYDMNFCFNLHVLLEENIGITITIIKSYLNLQCFCSRNHRKSISIELIFIYFLLPL